MAQVLRGKVAWADLNPTRGHEQAGDRPVLILSSAQSNFRSRMALIIPITSQPQRMGFPYALPLRSVDMPRPSCILTRHIRAVSTDRMRSIIGRVSNDELQDVVQALLHHFLPPDCEVTIGVFPDLA